MSIEHWTDEEGYKAIEKIGFLESRGKGIALARDHAREWLEARGVFVDKPGTCYRVYRNGGACLGEDGWVYDGRWLEFDDYDAALVAAVLACGG